MKILMTVALSALLAGGAFAQSTKGGGDNAAVSAEVLTGRMTKELNLKPGQVEQVRAINMKYAQQMIAERKAGGTDNSVQNKSLMNGELKAVLTPSQYEVWLRMQQDKATTEDGRKINPVKQVE